MVMKDKLYKNNHKGIYYKTRKIGFISLIVLSAFIAICVPTYINFQRQHSARAQKEGGAVVNVLRQIGGNTNCENRTMSIR